MSNHLAIAAISEMLRSIVETAAQSAVVGATAATGRPANVDPGENAAAVGVFLYRATPNVAWRNQAMPVRRSDGSNVRRPQTALDLHYLLTYFGDESDQEPERMLGAVLGALEAAPTLSRERVRSILPPTHPLGGTGLDRQIERVRFVPDELSLDELSKLWSMFVETPYRLSSAHRGAVVLIEPEETVAPTLPVRRRNVYLEVMERPVIDEVEGADGAGSPIVFGSELVVRGRRLAGEATAVVVTLGDGEAEASPADDAVGASEIRIPLDAPPFPADSLRPGIAGVHVAHRRMMGEPGFETPHRGARSNLAAFVLRPRIGAGGGLDGLAITTDVAVPPPPPPPPDPAPAAEPILVVGVEPLAAVDQEVEVLLHRTGESHTIGAWRRGVDADPLRFPIADVGAGTYTVRVRIDGAESMLETDDEGRYVRPRVTLP